jgi:hypothetical protein
MTVLKAARSAQYPLVATFTFNFNDTMLDTAGVSKDFKTLGTSIVADVIPLPVGATILSGEVVTETAVTGSTAYNVSIGDSGSATRYLGATDKKAAGRTALVPTGYVGTGENVRVTVAPTVADATAGKVTVRVEYVLAGRANETVVV